MSLSWIRRVLRISIVGCTLFASIACVAVDDPAPRPFTDLTGDWTGEVLGVRLQIYLEQRPYNNDPDFGILSGNGWLVFSTPAESLPMMLGGTNYREQTRPVSLVLGTGTVALYGELALTPKTDGTLSGTLRRRPDRPPTFSPFNALWPAGASGVPVSFVRF